MNDICLLVATLTVRLAYINCVHVALHLIICVPPATYKCKECVTHTHTHSRADTCIELWLQHLCQGAKKGSRPQTAAEAAAAALEEPLSVGEESGRRGGEGKN